MLEPESGVKGGFTAEMTADLAFETRGLRAEEGKAFPAAGSAGKRAWTEFPKTGVRLWAPVESLGPAQVCYCTWHSVDIRTACVYTVNERTNKLMSTHLLSLRIQK